MTFIAIQISISETFYGNFGKIFGMNLLEELWECVKVLFLGCCRINCKQINCSLFKHTFAKVRILEFTKYGDYDPFVFALNVGPMNGRIDLHNI